MKRKVLQRSLRKTETYAHVGVCQNQLLSVLFTLFFFGSADCAQSFLNFFAADTGAQLNAFHRHVFTVFNDSDD